MIELFDVAIQFITCLFQLINFSSGSVYVSLCLVIGLLNRGQSVFHGRALGFYLIQLFGHPDSPLVHLIVLIRTPCQEHFPFIQLFILVCNFTVQFIHFSFELVKAKQCYAYIFIDHSHNCHSKEGNQCP